MLRALSRLPITVAIASVLLAAGLTGTAQAADDAELLAAPGCTATYLCIWDQGNFQGARGLIHGNKPHYTALTTSSSICGEAVPAHTWNDCVSSIANSGASTVRLYVHANYLGHYHNLGVGDAVGNFRVEYGDPAFNDAISSSRFL
jgi:hypothetical protein